MSTGRYLPLCTKSSTNERFPDEDSVEESVMQFKLTKKKTLAIFRIEKAVINARWCGRTIARTSAAADRIPSVQTNSECCSEKPSTLKYPSRGGRLRYIRP